MLLLNKNKWNKLINNINNTKINNIFNLSFYINILS